MNIEQEFKEIKQLLLDSYKADYEDTLNQAIDKLDKLEEAINYTRCCTEFYCYNKKIDSKKCKNQCMGCEYYEESKSK
jgi:hypothetical protein